jgi:hypothetical protein
MARRGPEDYEARYQGLTGLVRLLMARLMAAESGKPAPSQGGPLPKTRRASAISAGDPTGGRNLGPNTDAVRAELDPNYRRRR